MATWAEFPAAEPALVAFDWERMEDRVVYQATLRLETAIYEALYAWCQKQASDA